MFLDLNLSSIYPHLSITIKGRGNVNANAIYKLIEVQCPFHISISVDVVDEEIDQWATAFLNAMSLLPVFTLKVRGVVGKYLLSNWLCKFDTDTQMEVVGGEITTYSGPLPLSPIPSVVECKITTNSEISEEILLRYFPNLETFDLVGRFKFGDSPHTFTRFKGSIEGN